MTKRSADSEEELAEAELAAAITAAKEAPGDEEISGLSCGTAMLHFDVPGVPAKQYKAGRLRGEKPLVFLYLCIRGLGETPRMMLAECGAPYIHLASPMGETQAVSCEWRTRSPNGLAPMLSGLGVPRASPICQSGTIIRFLAQRFGMAGETELDGLYADVLYETAKDLGSKKAEVTAPDGHQTSGAKGPFSTADKIAAMIDKMPNPKDEDVALNFGQIELLKLLIDCEETSPGCVKQLSPALDAFRAAGAARSRIAAYLKSPLRFPAIKPGYIYKDGPIRRSAFAMT